MFKQLLLVALAAITSPLAMSAPIAKRDTDKIVAAHFMIGNSYPYEISTWESDMKLAASYGIDAFALNVGSDSWQPARVADAYTAAAATGFKLFMSLDMTVLQCSSSSDMATVLSFITTHLNDPATVTLNGKPVLSTFAGEACTFGADNVNDGWTQLLSGLNVEFIPSFFVDPATFPTYTIANGMMNWNAGWPLALTQDTTLPVPALATDLLAPAQQALIGSTATDLEYVSNLAGKSYMATVSPTFFTHYPQSTLNKNFIYSSDEHLFATRWEKLMSIRDSVDIVEIISWNDYGESHYVGPSNTGAAPAGTTWLDGFDHTAFLSVAKYYAEAFKTGSYPTITKDQLVMSARPHSKDSTATNDDIGKPTGYEQTSDTFWVIAFLTAPATVTLSTSPTNTKTFIMPYGAVKLSIPLVAGGPLAATITRNGADVVSLTSTNYTFVDGPVDTYNFNLYALASD